ncbi:MAG: 30S ribosomal protein S26e [Candidatus Kariarchaeaceae archaeon]
MIAKKRRSGGRSGGKRGNNTNDQCSNCGRMVPSDKIKKVSKYVSLVDPRMRKELREAGAVLPRRKVTENFCVSCAVHYGKVKIRSKDKRKP